MTIIMQMELEDSTGVIHFCIEGRMYYNGQAGGVRVRVRGVGRTIIYCHLLLLLPPLPLTVWRPTKAPRKFEYK